MWCVRGTQAGFEFSASERMSQLNESMFNASMDVILAKATCRLLSAQRSLQHPPTFTDNFLKVGMHCRTMKRP